MKTEYKKPKISTQGQARDKSKKAGCSRVTLEVDQEIRNKSYTVHEDTIVLMGGRLKIEDTECTQSKYLVNAKKFAEA